MTEQELVLSMNALMASARAVLQGLLDYGSQASGNVNFQFGGSTYTLKCLQQQIAEAAAQQAADRVAFSRNFGGVPASQSVARNAAGLLTAVTTVLDSGYQIVQTPSRDAFGKITAVAVQVKDQNGNVVWSGGRTINRTNGLYSGAN